MERFLIVFLSCPVPGVQLWFYLHICVWSTHRSLALRLPWSSWVCPSEERAQRWYDCLDCGSPSGAKCAGKPLARDARDMALGSRHMRASPEGAFSIAWQLVHESQPWEGFFYCSSAGASMWGERGYNSGSTPACDSAVVTCFHGSPVFLRRHSLLWFFSLPSPQSVSPQPTAVLALGLFSNPHSSAPSLLAHLWTQVPVHVM